MNKNIKYSQNFLTSEKVLNKIIKQLNLKETDTVYEIGTGTVIYSTYRQKN
ncbi:erythromycin ribosome methylase [Streptococcus pneumoniae]|nr:erythromycin ribosome methylase [Streptococcus pneumoniae]